MDINIEIENIDCRAVQSANDKITAEILIEEFRPFLHGCVAKYCLSGDEHQRDEMFSIAMIAFYEAIKSYQPSKGHFLPFASTVISRRLIDHIRKIYTDRTAVSLEHDAESSQEDYVASTSLKLYDAQTKHERLVLEIEQFKAELAVWGITMKVLSSQSPKHAKLRETYHMIVDTVAKNDEIMHIIQIKRYFPVKKVAELTGVPQKKVERARIYILASLIILTGDYEYLSDYIKKDRHGA